MASLGPSTLAGGASFFHGGVNPPETQPVITHRIKGATADINRLLAAWDFAFAKNPASAKPQAAAIVGFVVALVTTLTPQIRQQTRPTPQLVGDIVIQELPHLAAEVGVLNVAPR